MKSSTTPDKIFRNGRFTTLGRKHPQATAAAINDGLFYGVGDDDDDEIMKLAASSYRPQG
jgi:predicted amidohydrolase YtcJ